MSTLADTYSRLDHAPTLPLMNPTYLYHQHYPALYAWLSNPTLDWTLPLQFALYGTLVRLAEMLS